MAWYLGRERAVSLGFIEIRPNTFVLRHRILDRKTREYREREEGRLFLDERGYVVKLLGFINYPRRRDGSLFLFARW